MKLADDRLHWQCRRGMLELDILLQDFLDQQYQGLSDSDKELFKELLTYPDQVLLDHLLGRAAPIDAGIAHVVSKIRHPVTS